MSLDNRLKHVQLKNMSLCAAWTQKEKKEGKKKGKEGRREEGRKKEGRFRTQGYSLIKESSQHSQRVLF